MLYREDDRVILQACQKMGAKPETFQHVANGLKNKTADEVRLWITVLHPLVIIFLTLNGIMSLGA